MAKTNFSELISSNIPVLIDFSAEWCGPCKMMVPVLQELKSELGESAKIVKIDVDQNQNLAQQFQVMSVPTLMIFKDGELKWRQPGIKSASQLKALVESFA